MFWLYDVFGGNLPFGDEPDWGPGNEAREIESGAGVGFAVAQELVRRVRRKVAMIKSLRMVEVNYMQFMKAQLN